MAQKRTLDSFFAPAPKKTRPTTEKAEESPRAGLSPCSPGQARPGKEINDEPDLDLLYFEPYIPPHLAKELFQFLRSELPFYRVEYKISRGGIATDIRTPRYTTVFGIDETCRFDDDGAVVDPKSGFRVQDKQSDKHPPRPIPKCLDGLRRSTEAATGCKFNFCLVNYYASGADSIAFHSDDERFLGPRPAIASFSLGARRDFLLKRKPVPAPAAAETQEPGHHPLPAKTLKFPLGSGDMVLMRGPTQAAWLHSVPKRGGKNVADGGRINITFRRAMVKGGTENYYNYNVGAGPVYRWDKTSREMRVSKE